MKTYLYEHWLGQHSFMRAVGLNVILTNCFVISILTCLNTWFEISDKAPHYLLVVFLLLLSLVILTWQTIGAFRSATQSIRNHGSSAHYYSVFAIMLISCVAILGSFATLSGGHIDYQQQAVDAYTAPAQKFHLSATESGNLNFDGEIGRGATRALRELVRDVPKGTLLTLNSMGGLIVEARGMANVVKEFGLNTKVVQRCYSACTLVFIAAAERLVDPQGALGFHQYNLYSQSPLPWIVPEEQHKQDLALFHEKHVSDWFLEKAYSTPHQSIWVPSQDELLAAGVITRTQY